MKKFYSALAFLALPIITLLAQDTLFIVKSKQVVMKIAISNIDSVIFYNPFFPDTTIVKDIEGNIYKVVRIGTQSWMAENLRTTKYNNGLDIPNITDAAAWQALTTPAYCWYGNDENNKNPYGAIYNWYTVNTGKLCPTDWHVPTENELLTLMNYLGGYIVAGGKLKETGTTHWLAPNTDATNESGFTAIGSGERNADYSSSFTGMGETARFWLSNEHSSTEGRRTYLDFNSAYIIRGFELKFSGHAVRCIKN